jgi:hypothetical protein
MNYTFHIALRGMPSLWQTERGMDRRNPYSQNLNIYSFLALLKI